jgi:transposase InsO family protein
VRYGFIEAHVGHHAVSKLCQSLGVSRSGYYAWCRRDISQRGQVDEVLIDKIRAVYRASEGTYGSPHVHAQLRAQGEGYGQRRIARLMRTHALRGIAARRRRRSARARRKGYFAPNHLGRRFWVDKPNQRWVSDVTFIPTREGFMYLATVMDLYSRRIVGWSMTNRQTHHLAVDALKMAIEHRRPPPGCLVHSDQGTQYVSASYQAQLAQHGLVCSMSGKGACADNAAMESFFHTMKTERMWDRTYQTRDEARHSVFDYIEVFYNRKRLHSTLDYRSPVEYEQSVTSP